VQSQTWQPNVAIHHGSHPRPCYNTNMTYREAVPPIAIFDCTRDASALLLGCQPWTQSHPNQTTLQPQRHRTTLDQNVATASNLETLILNEMPFILGSWCHLHKRRRQHAWNGWASSP
jgi:hypothetical protein